MVVVLAAGMAAPGMAAAQQQCPEANPTYTDVCGPMFTTPPWGDAGGWADPSQYSTIKLADLNGDGKDELIGRNDQGLEIWWFDTSIGQWRPQVDANQVTQVLTDFRSPLPSEQPATDWTRPEYYSTIQAADVDGQPGAEILARFSDGMRVYEYTPPAGGGIDGGTWNLLSSGGPFSDADGYDDPSLYSTIRVGHFNPGVPPLLFARQHSTAGDPTLGFFQLDGRYWDPLQGTQTVDIFTDQNCATPSCYLTFQTANLPPDGQDLANNTAEVVGRTGIGVSAWDLASTAGDWNWFTNPQFTNWSAPFTDQPGGQSQYDCPFSNDGATGPGSGDCLGSSPAYYETLQTGNLITPSYGAGDELLARTSDGLRVRRWTCCYGGGVWPWINEQFPLPALGGAPSNVPDGLWGSIRTGDIDANGTDEVLALDGQALQVWSNTGPYGSFSWNQLQPSTPLALTGEWLTNPAYYSTIQVGDVDGDNREDVIARGQFGIRTWFYNRRGTGGWERYLAAEGYPDFPGGQAAAYDALNKLAVRQGVIGSGTIRDVWTGVTAPVSGTLGDLQTDLENPLLGNCPAQNQTNIAPPIYSACNPPDGVSQADWTAVVNEMLSESYFAQQVVLHFNDLETMRSGLIESEDGSLPAIAADLQLPGAAGNTTSFDMQDLFAGLMGLAGSLAGFNEELSDVGSALWVASGIFSMLPSGSQTASSDSSFQGTYTDLLGRLATARDQMKDALSAQRQQVLGDPALLDLVGQLRSAGTWKPDTDGMQGASREGFALQTYQALMPTVYQRWVVTNCTTQQYSTGTLNCELPSGTSVIGSGGGLNATWIAPALSSDPCPPSGYYDTNCDFTQIPGKIPDVVANMVWGPIADTCQYKPPNKLTLWKYGCSLGVPTGTTIVADSPGWTFATQTGNPVIHNYDARRAVRAVPGVVRAGAVAAGSSARARAAASARAARDRLGPLRFAGRLGLSRALRLRRMRVVVERTLFEHGRREELARSGSGRRLRPFALRHVRGGLFTSRRRGRPRVRLHLQRLDAREGAQLALSVTRVRIRDIRALCGVLPARVSRAGRPLELETRLRLRDRGTTGRITMRQRWRCVRDRKGEFTGIRSIRSRRPAARPGLAVRLHAPRVAGRRATVLVTVTNRRRPRFSRVVSSLWHLQITGTAGGRPRTVGFKELRAGHSRRLRLSLPVRRVGRRLACVRVAAAADSARPAGARRCVRVASPPQVTG